MSSRTIARAEQSTSCELRISSLVALVDAFSRTGSLTDEEIAWLVAKTPLSEPTARSIAGRLRTPEADDLHTVLDELIGRTSIERVRDILAGVSATIEQDRSR